MLSLTCRDHYKRWNRSAGRVEAIPYMDRKDQWAVHQLPLHFVSASEHHKKMQEKKLHKSSPGIRVEVDKLDKHKLEIKTTFT
jgi:hypothetical protein